MFTTLSPTHPLRRSTSPFTASVGEAFQSENGLINHAALSPHIFEHLVNVHALRAPDGFQETKEGGSFMQGIPKNRMT